MVSMISWSIILGGLELRNHIMVAELSVLNQQAKWFWCGKSKNLLHNSQPKSHAVPNAL